MAADSQGTACDNTRYRCDKLFRIRGLLVGVCGEDKGTSAFIDYFRSGGGDPDEWDFEDGLALVLCPRRGILRYEGTGRPDKVHEPFFAIGSGAPIALGAMEAGATAEQAVAAACRWNTECGLPVVSMHIGKSYVKRQREKVVR